MSKRKVGTMVAETAPAAPQPALESPEEEAEECVICLGSSPDKGRLKCSHTFCFDCIQDWSKHENTCPLCKKRFTEIEKLDQNRVLNGKARRQKVKVKRTDQAQSREREMHFGGGDFLQMIFGSAPGALSQRFFLMSGPIGVGVPRAAPPMPPTPPSTISDRSRHNTRNSTRAGLLQGEHGRQRRRIDNAAVVDLVEREDDDEDIIIGGTHVVGPTTSQAATRALRANVVGGASSSAEVIDLVDDAPTLTAQSSSSSSTTPPRNYRNRGVTVMELGAGISPLSPFAVASMFDGRRGSMPIPVFDSSPPRVQPLGPASFMIRSFDTAPMGQHHHHRLPRPDNAEALIDLTASAPPRSARMMAMPFDFVPEYYDEPSDEDSFADEWRM